MSHRVLVTGVNGFAGRYIVPRLKSQGFEVFGLCGEGHEPLAIDGLTQLRGLDLRNLDAVKASVADIAPNYVVHLAAISFVGHQNVSEIYETNIVGTRNLLEALTKVEQVTSVLLTSSANVYGNSDVGVISEDVAPNPANDYAVSKIAMEYMARQYTSRLSIKIVRPFNYTGRGQSENFLVPKIINHFRRRLPTIELGNLDVARDFTDVRAVAEYFGRLLTRSQAGPDVFNICTGKTYTLKEIVQICEEISGHSIEVKVNPAFVRANEIKSLAGDPSRLEMAVGRVDHYPMEETLRWMLTEPL